MLDKMFGKILGKFNNNFKIYRNDLSTKGLYWSIIHRLYKIPNGKKTLIPFVNYLKPSYVKAYGHKFFIDKKDQTISQELLQSKKWEEYEINLFKKNIKKGNVVIDVG